MFPTVRFLDKETGFDTSDMRATAACPLCFCYADRQIAAGIVHNASPSISISSCVPLDRMRIPIPPLLERLNNWLQRLSQLGQGVVHMRWHLGKNGA